MHELASLSQIFYNTTYCLQESQYQSCKLGRIVKVTRPAINFTFSNVFQKVERCSYSFESRTPTAQGLNV